MSNPKQDILSNGLALLIPSVIARDMPPKQSAQKVMYGFILRLSSTGVPCFAGDSYLASAMGYSHNKYVQKQLISLSRKKYISRNTYDSRRRIKANIPLDDGYIMVPADVVKLAQERKVSFAAAILYGVLWSHRKKNLGKPFGEDDVCYVRPSKLAWETGTKDNRQVRKYLDELVQNDLIKEFYDDADCHEWTYPYVEYSLNSKPKVVKSTGISQTSMRLEEKTTKELGLPF